MHGVPRLLSFIVFAALLTPPLRVDAQGLGAREAVERFYTATELSPEWFSASFLAAVPFEQIPQLRTQLVASLGAFQEVRADGDRWLAVFERGSIPTLADVDAEGRFVGLRLLSPIARVRGYEDLLTRFEELPGEGALLVLIDGNAQLAHAADVPLPVGSAFKFVVLRALVQAIGAGNLAWDQVVVLGPEHRTIATGTLSQWPDGAPLTLYALAAWMISESDNTATDALIAVLGREAVEAADPSGRNRPFLTTLEAFKLKDAANVELLERWRVADEAGRREVLAALAGLPIPSATIFAEGPRATDVEWYFTARELCALATELADIDLLTINPGVVAKSQFDRVVFKGGSEPGVLNLTTWVRTRGGREACVCATLQAETPIETSTLGGVVGSAFELVRGR